MEARSTLLTLAALATTLLVPTRAAARSGPEPPRRLFEETLEVRVVEIEAVVTDRKGSPVTGLAAEDFDLRVDGEPVAVEFFDEVRDGQVVAPEPTVPSLLTRGPASTPGGGKTAPGERARPVPRSLVIFVDDTFTARRYRRKLLERLAGRLDSLEPTDRVAVVRFTSDGVEVVLDWATSAEEIARALAWLGEQPTDELRRIARFSSLSRVEPSRFGGPRPSLIDENRPNSLRTQLPVLRRQIVAVGDAMASTMGAFADAPGRKLLVPVTSGWPWDFTGFSGASADDLTEEAAKLAAARSYGGRGLLELMTDTANNLGFTIYPFHLGDVHKEVRGRNRRGPGEVRVESLRRLAEATGGRLAGLGGPGRDPWRPVLDDTRSYYVLAFTRYPEPGAEPHEVTVEVADRKLTVRHREAFQDLTHRQRIDRRTAEALLREVDGPQLVVSFGVPKKAGRKVVEVPVLVRVPWSWPELLPTGEGSWAAHLEMRVVAMDGKGQRSEIPVVPLTLPSPGPEPTGELTYRFPLRLRKAPHRLAISLYDRGSGTIRSAVRELLP